MKLRLPHLLRRLLVAAMTVTGVTVGTSNTQAGVMHEDISIMTYTDFGQNKGRYTTTTNALLNYIRQRDGGIVITYTGGQDPYTISNEQGMISYESQTDNGAAAAVGYSYLGTVEHNGEIDASFGSRYLGWDNCVKYSAIEYRYIGEYRNVPNTDYKVTRQSKIITDVTPSTLFTGDVTKLGGTLMYRAGAGDMYIRDAEGNQPHVMEGYNYIIGGINNIDGIWYNDDNHLSYSGEWTVDFSATGLAENPLANALGAGDSGSPVWIYNSATKQYEYLMASQAGSVTTYSIARGAGEYSQQVIDDDTVAVNASSTTLYINQVSDTAASTVTAGEIESFIWQGTITNGTDTVATFNGVKTGVNTWADLSGLKDQQNWYGYGEDYLNAVWSNPTDAKPLTFADLFHTNNVLFGTTMVDDVVTPTTNTAYNIILTDTVDLGVGYARFVGSGNTFTITSEGEENNQFNHAGYVVEAGATVHLQLTNLADYMYEWRKTGAGDLYIDGEGDTNALLNLGGAGKTYLQQTGGHAAYNVLANNGTYVSIKDVTQIDRDFTFGLGGATLDLNGVSMDWYYTAETADNLDDTRFSINALTEEAIIANSSSTASTLTFKESGNQTFLGSFRDTETGALNIVYDVADGTWTLHSIWTDLSNHADSGLSVAQGKVILVGTHTKHAIGSAGATTTNRYSSELDWHYADAKMNVSVDTGATFELGSHARLTGNVTVADGGTFIMREGVQHAQEYIEGGQTLENTEDIAAYYGLKGNVTLQSGATMQVAYNSGVTANNTYSGNITGAGNVSIDLGHKKAHFTLAGTNTFSGTKTLTQGFLIATNTAALGDTTTNKWVINEDAVLTVESGLTSENALGYIDSASSGSLALTEDMTDVLDMRGHSTLFIGAMEGMTVQYGTADDTLTPTADSKWNLGGGGGELVVNAQLTDGSLVLGNGSNEGIVTLTNTNNQIDSITFNGGVVLNISDNDALGGARITLGYSSAMMTDSDTAGLLSLVTTDSQGAIMLDNAQNADADLSGHAAVALGSYNTTEYSGNITVATDAAYRFGGARGKLVLTNALAANGTNALILDGQTTSGGALQLNAVSAITGQVSIMGYDTAKTQQTKGDMTLTFGVDNALANVSGVKVNAGGTLDVGSTTQTLKDVQVNAGGLIKGNADGTLIFNMTVDGLRQEGAMQLGKAEKIGSGTLLLSVSGNTWDLLTIKEGKVFTQVNNALSETGITRVENGGELNLNTWDGDGFRGRTMGGNIELGDGGVVSVGTIFNESVNTVTFNGSISVDKGATGTIDGGYWYVTGAANNVDGGTLAFNASALHLDQTYAQSFGGTFDIASSGVTMYSGGSGSNMLKHFSHLDLDSGKTLTVEDATWNTIWQMDKLTGAGTITWNSDTTHDYTARMLLSGDGAFSGTINFNRNFGAGERTHQAFLEISSETAATGAVLNMDGNANSYATLALNADTVRLGGVSGDEYSHIMTGAAPTASASTAAPSSTRATRLILTGSGTYTYSGSIGKAADTATTAVSLTMEGSGIQTISGTTVVLNDVAALSGTLQVSATNFTLLGDATVKQGATLKLGDAFTLSSGHTLHVQGSDSADTATFDSAITFDSGVLSFDASDLSTIPGTYSLSVGTATGTGTINFENTGTLDMGTYYLASGDWSGAKLTLDASLGYMNATINNTASGLSVTLSLGAGSNIWNGTDSANSWTADTFGTTAATMTGTAVFNDDAANKTVAVSGNQTLTNLRFDSTGAYQLNVGEGASVAADNLYQVGSGSTTLSGSVSIGTATQIDAGSLVVTGSNQSLGTISGEGELVIDWGASGSGSLTITELGTLNVQSGSYGDAAATTAVNAKNIIVGSGATYLHGSGSYIGHITSEGGTITTHGGSLNGTMTVEADTTLNVAADTNLNTTLTQNAGQLVKTGSGTLILNGSATGVVLQDMAVQAGTLEYESGTFSAGILNIDAGATLRVDQHGNLTAETINLSGTLHMENGNGNYIDADIVTSDGAIIRGTSWGSGSVVNGTLKGEGKLTLMGVNPWNKYTVNSLISDAEGKQLAVEFDGQPAWASDGSDVAVTFAGANTYSGGTTITFGTLNTSSQTALGSGAVSMNGGKLSLNSDLTVSSVSNTDAGLTGTINLNGNTLTVDGNVTATYDAVLTGGSIAKVGSGTQTFSQATALQNISVSEGTLNLTADSVSGSIEVTGGELALASSYTLGEGQSLLVGSNTSLGGLTLGGGVIMLDGTSLREATALLSTGTVTGNVATTILLAGGMPNVAGTYMLASGNWDGINTANIAVAAQQTYAARSGAASEFESSLTANADGLYLTLDEIVTDSNIWAPTVADSDDTWSSTSFSQYGTGAVGADATAIFNADAIDKSVRVTEAVSIGGMEITGGGYSFSGSQISTGTLSVSGGGDASSIDNVNVTGTEDGTITVDGSELTIVQLTPVNPSAPIALSNAAKLTIGSADHRYDAFSGKVTGDAGSQLHLYTWQADGSEDHAEDGRVHLLTDSTVQDVYIHGDLALNLYTNDSNQTNLQAANLHMDAGRSLVIRSTEATLTPTSGNIVMAGDLSLQVYGQVGIATTLTSDFTLAEGAIGTLTKTDGGSITLSGTLAVSGVTASAGTLKLTGANTQTMVYTVNSGATLTLSGDSTYSFDASAVRTISGTLNVDSTVNVSGTQRITVESGGKLVLGNGASFNRTSGNGGAYWLKGSLEALQDATASFSTVDDVHFYEADNGEIHLQSGSTLNMSLKSLQYWKQAEINLGENATLNLTTSGGVYASGDDANKKLDINLAAGATFDAQNSAVTLNGSSTLTVGSGATAKFKTATFNDGSIITLQGGRLELNLGTANATTAVSSLVVNNTAATAETPSTSVVYNGGSQESMGRTFNSVTIAANNTLELQQNNWNTIWTINDLSGAGNLTWKSTTTHNSSSRLIITGDNDFSGNITLNREVDNVGANGNWQAFLVLASDTAAKSATVTLTGADSEDNAIMAVDTANAQVMGVSGNEYSHIYAGAAKTSVSGSDTAPASTASNTLTIAGAGGTFAGTVGTDAETEHLNLLMNGTGTQTFSGVAHVGDVGVQAGTLALTNAASTVSGDISVSGGTLEMAALTLGADQSLSVLTGVADTVQLAGLTLAGGEMVFDASLLGTDSAALSVGTVSQTQGSSITFTNEGQLESGRYMLAAGNWATGGELSFTTGGLSNGSATVVSTDSGLYLDYVSNLLYTWDAGNGNWNYAETNWDTTPDGTADGNMAFAADKVAVFETNAAVTVSEAVSASQLIVRDGATLTLTETAALTAAAIEVEAGSTLSFATQKAGYTAANISGAGTVELNLSNANNTLNLGANFTGETYVKSGKVSTSDMQAGSTLRLANGVNMFANGGDIQTNIVLDGTTEVSFSTGTDTNFYGKVSGGTFKHIGNGYYDFYSTVDLTALTLDSGNMYGRDTFKETTNIDQVYVDGGYVYFEKDSTVGTLTMKQRSQASLIEFKAGGTHAITSATIEAGTLNILGATTIGSATISGGTVKFAAQSAGSTGGTITMTGGTLELNLETSQAEQTLLSSLVVNNTSEAGGTAYVKNTAGAESMVRTLHSVTIAANKTLQFEQSGWNTIWNINDLSGAGNLTWKSTTTHWTASSMVFKGDGSDYTGTIMLERTKGVADRSHQAYMEVASNDAVQGATMDLQGVNNGVASLAINAENVTMQGLKGNDYSHLYAGAASTGIGNGSDNSNVNHAFASTAANTLTIAGAGDYTFAGTVGTDAETEHLNLVMNGAGTQTFSGVAHVGDVSVNAGSLVLSNASSTVSGDITVSGGALTYAGSYTLGSGDVLSVLTGAENAVQLGGISLEGGQLTFDAAALTANTAALNVSGTVGAGTGATVTLDFSKLTGALSTGTYMLAAGNWTGAALNYNGSGVGTVNATESGLYLDYTNDSVYTWVAGATSADGTADTAWSSANWDLVPDTDAGTNISFTTGKDAIFVSAATVSVTDAVSAGTVYINNGAQVSLGMAEGGSFVANRLLVSNGKLTLGSEKNWSGIKDITVKQDGILELAYGTSINNTADPTEILLQGGAINLRNGGGAGGALHANITVDKAGTIAGSLFGGATTVSGSITGTGTLTFAKELVDNGTNSMTISATMTDGADGALAVNITDAKVEYNNAKGYTGGTTIGETGTLKISGGGQEDGALQGAIDVYGTLELATGDVTGWSSTKGVKAINVYDDGILNVNTTGNQTGAGLAINLQGGSMTGVSNANFDLGYGGSVYGNSSINALAAAGATAENPTESFVDTVKITLRQYTTKFDVAENAKLNISSVIQNNNKDLLNDEANPGSDTFTKTGLGELVLSGANTFTYATTVEAGTLTLLSGGALNSNVTVNAGATFKLDAATQAMSFGKTISGAGTVVKSGANLLTLTTAQTLTALDVQAGFVQANAALNVGTLTLAAGTGFAYDLSSTPALVTAASYHDALALNLSNVGAAQVGQSYDLFQGAAGLSASQVSVSGYDTGLYQITTNVSDSGMVNLGVYYTGMVWNTGGASDTWSVGGDANWNSADQAVAFTAGADVRFVGTGETVTLDGTVAPGNMTVHGTDYRFEGGAIAATGSLNVQSGASATLTQAATFAGGVTVDGALTYDVAADQEIAFTGTIAGSGELHKTGAGTLNLGAIKGNTTALDWVVSNGTLKWSGTSGTTTNDEDASNDPAFVRLITHLQTTGTGKLLVDGNVRYCDMSVSEADSVVTIDDAIEITGELQINSWGTNANYADKDGYRKYVLADGADLTVGGMLWLTNKQKMVVQTGAVLNANGGIKLGHDQSGMDLTSRFVVEGGEVKTTGITFRRDGNPRTGNAFIMTGGRVEFAPASATTNVIVPENDGAASATITKGEVSLTGGTLVANESSWLMDAGSAENFHIYGVTFETAADKSITLAGNINFTPAEGANGTLTKTGAGLLVFDVADKTLAGLDIQAGWVQVQQALSLSGLTLAEGAGFAYDLSSTPAIVTADTYNGALNFRLDNLAALGTYELFQGAAGISADTVTLSGYNADMFNVTASANETGMVSISVAYAGMLWDTDFAETNTWVAADGETTWNGGEGTENTAYTDGAKVIFAGAGEEITISGNVTPGAITVTGTGYSFVADATNGGSIIGDGRLTVENGADLTISTANSYTGGTVVEEGGKLTITHAQAIGDSAGKLGTLSGEGTLVINLANASDVAVAYDANLGGFTGLVDIQQGQLYVGNLNTENSGRNATFNAERVLVQDGAALITHMADNAFASDVDMMSGATFGNKDGNISYTGDFRFNLADAEAGTFNATGTVKIQQHWTKILTFEGLLAGEGTVEMYSSATGDATTTYKLTNGDNSFSGTYKLVDGSTNAVILALGHQNAAQYATINLASTSAVSQLHLDSDATIAALNSTDADNLVTTTGAYTLAVSSGSFAGKLQNGTGALSLTKQGNGTLTLSGANTYTGATTISGGTLELAGAVSMAAESAISLASGTTLLLNASNTTAMVLGNGITGDGTIHKKGANETVLSGNVDVAAINVKDGTNQATNAGMLTLTGTTVTADTLYAAYGQVNIGAETNGNTFMQVAKVELGDSTTDAATNGLTVQAGSTLSVTGNNSNGGNDYKNASFQLSEWNSVSTLTVKGKLLIQNAKVLIGDDAANINIIGGTMAVQGITHARADKSTNVALTLSDNGTLILGESGIDTYKPFTATLGAGTVGMSAATTTIAEDLTLNSATGTTFDTTQYSFVTNADGVATDIERGTTAGTMTLSGAISAADAKMNVVGNGELNVTGAATLGYLDVAAGATASFAGGITDTILVDNQKNPANTVVSGAGKLNLQAGNSEVEANVALDEFTGRVNVAESANLTANITVEANDNGTATKLDGTHDITDTTLNLTLNNEAHLLGDMTGDRTINIDHLNVVGNATFGTGGAIDSQTYKGFQSTFNISLLQGVMNPDLPNKLTLVSNSNTAACTIFNVADLGSFYGDIVVSAENTGNSRRVALNLETNSDDTEELLLWYAYSTIELNTKDANSADDKAALGVIYDTALKGIKGDDTSGVIVAGKITDATFDSTATEHVTLRLGSWTEDEDFESAATIKSKLNLYKQGVNTQSFTGDTTAFDGSVTVEEGVLAFGTSSLKTADTTVGKHSVTTDDDGTITDTAIPQLSYGEGRVTVQANNGENDATLGAAQFSYDSESGKVTISSHTPAEGQEKETITATNSLITIAQGASLTVDSMIISDSSRISGTAAAVATYAARSAGSVSELTLTDSTVVLGAGNDSVVGDTTPQTLSSLQPMGGSGEALTLSGTSNVLTITSDALSNLTVTGGSDFLVDFSQLLTVKGLEDVDFIRLDFNNVAISTENVSMTGLLTSSTGAQFYLTSYFTGGDVPSVGSVYFDVRSIPEPTSTTLSVLALAGLMLRRRRK